jgi:hypothetical protein
VSELKACPFCGGEAETLYGGVAKMALTRPIPKQAMPIVELIRWWVPKPKRRPVPYFYTGICLRFKGKCPMGLLPFAEGNAPFKSSQCGGAPTSYIGRFAAWWDEQSDPKAAMDAVWNG